MEYKIIIYVKNPNSETKSIQLKFEINADSSNKIKCLTNKCSPQDGPLMGNNAVTENLTQESGTLAKPSNNIDIGKTILMILSL